LLVVLNERSNRLDNLVLLASRQLGDFLKRLAHFPHRFTLPRSNLLCDSTSVEEILGGTSRYEEVVFTKDAARRITKATQGHRGRRLAILVNGKLISAPVVRGGIFDKAAISRESITKDEAERIAATLNSG
jgi:SecDF, P1 head subdomain